MIEFRVWFWLYPIRLFHGTIPNHFLEQPYPIPAREISPLPYAVDGNPERELSPGIPAARGL